MRCLKSDLFQLDNEYIVPKPPVQPGSHPGIFKSLSLAPHVLHAVRRHALLVEEHIMQRANALRILIYKPPCSLPTMKAGGDAIAATQLWNTTKAAYI
jgi:hypothetical protein